MDITGLTPLQRCHAEAFDSGATAPDAVQLALDSG
jgi:hypothetical protein